MIFPTVIAIALAFWGGHPPACDTLRVAEQPLAGPTIGQAKYKSGRCAIIFDTAIRKRRTRCHVAVHEMGHLHGIRHVKDPTSVMYPWYHGWTIRRCVRFGHPPVA